MILAALAASLVSLALNLLTGHHSGAVWSAILAGIFGWLLIRLRRANESPAQPAPGRDSPRKIVTAMGPLALVPLILGVIVTISAAHTSGTQQDLSILLAAVLYLTAAGFLGVTVWVITHPLPDDDTPETTETNRPENPDTGDASADRQQ